MAMTSVVLFGSTVLSSLMGTKLYFTSGTSPASAHSSISLPLSSEISYSFGSVLNCFLAIVTLALLIK